MKQVGWMVAGCVGSWLFAAAVSGRPAEWFLGMLAPLAATASTWWLIDRVHRVDPARVTSVLLRAFGAKLVFFGAYVIVVSRLWPMDIALFGAAFTAYFVALYAVHAVLLHGLGAVQMSQPLR